MISVYAGITVLVVILELSAFMSLFWRSVDREPHRRWPRLQAPLRMLPRTRGIPVSPVSRHGGGGVRTINGVCVSGI